MLCEKSEEDVHHLFMACPFSVCIRAYFETKYRISFPPLNTISSHLALWFKSVVRSTPFRYLPLFIFWGIWLLRNNCLFENRKPVFFALISRVEGFLNSYPVPMKIKKIRNIGSTPLKAYPCGFFDGATPKNIGGSGFVIYLITSHYFSFSMGCGCNTNTRAELLALWAVLKVILMMGLSMHLIHGDSMVIISWLNRLSALDVPSVMHWCIDIRNILHLAPPVIFKHIFREHNSLADGLSKQDLK